MKEYIIVSGSPRSGTSATMRVLRDSGFLMHGDKFPKIADRTDGSEIEQYLLSKKVDAFKPEEQINEQGFFEEGGMVMHGIANTIASHLDTIPTGSVIKIIGAGLKNTDPTIVSKLIYCLRDPITCALAQLKLRPRRMPRGIPFESQRPAQKRVVTKIDLSIDLRPKRITPKRERRAASQANGKMWLRDTKCLLEFILAYPEVPVFISDYAGFSKDQATWLQDCGAFLGKDLKPIETITPRKPKDLPEEYWTDLLSIYVLILDGQYQKALNRANVVDFSRASTQFDCPRAGRVDKAQCGTCFERPAHKPNLYKMLSRRSTRREIDWIKEPCYIECKEHGVSVADSIKNNFWITQINKTEITK